MYNGLMKKNTAYQYGCKLTNELNTCVLNTASGGGVGKLPNSNCDQTTKWKISRHTNHK